MLPQFAYSFDRHSYTGPFNSRQEAIAAGIERSRKIGAGGLPTSQMPVWISTKRNPDGKGRSPHLWDREQPGGEHAWDGWSVGPRSRVRSRSPRCSGEALQRSDRCDSQSSHRKGG